MQLETTLIRTHRARDDVRDLVRDLIASGDLRGGSRLEEVGLSQRIGVSRTPLREALIALEEEGWVCSTPNKGFSVLAVDAVAVREIYPILGALEGAAIALSGEKLRAALPELRELNRKLASNQPKRRKYAVDRALHERLVRECSNDRLLKLIRRHWALAACFDGADDRGNADPARSCREHEVIIAAIEREDFIGAAAALSVHWRGGVETVTGWLQANLSA